MTHKKEERGSSKKTVTGMDSERRTYKEKAYRKEGVKH
jgi:hypothetical protein